METFGEWLRRRRIQLKLTHKELADRVGCSAVTIRKIEYGERRPSAQIAELLANSLGIPLEERSTFVKVARGELGVNRLSTPLKLVAVTPAPRSNLPVLPTPFIGRQHEVEELSHLLRDPQCRLLTLVGPGGVGKTRLAIETAAHIQDAFADGAYFVPFTPVNSTRFIIPVIADAVGLAFESSNRADPKTQLFSFLREKQALLLADNLEQLLAEPGIELLAELLANAPQMSLLATSRESLGLQDEWVFEVHGLPVPEAGQAERSGQNDSVELFLQRARRAHVGFNARSEDYPTIVHICRLVDGMPLAIELAAAWVRTLSCDEIEQEIERGMDFLSISARDIPVRHRSMRAVFDQSWNLLTEEEQGVLLRLSVFRNGFQREAAEAVAGATLPVLSSLVTKSLIRRSGLGRYDLHELILHFATEQLAERPDELTATQARHGSYYLTYFSLADGRLRSATQRETLAELTAEMDNFRAAWDWAVGHGEFALIEQTMRPFKLFYDTHGWYQEGLDTLDRTITALEMAHGHSALDRTNLVALGHILAIRSWLACRLAHYERAQAMLEHSVDILRPLNEPRVLVEAITDLGWAMELTGNHTRALELYSEGLEVAKAIGDRWHAALCLTLHTALVGNTHDMVKPQITHERLRSVVADWRVIGDPRLTAFALNILSRSALRLGRYDEARLALEENVALNSSIGFGWGLGTAYRGLGLVAQAEGEHERALDMFQKSLDTFTELGARYEMARVLAEMSRSTFELGISAEAERKWRESLGIATETQGTFIVLEALVGLAGLQAKRNDREHALELVWLVLNHPASLQETKNRARDLRAELEARLTSQQVEAVKERAQTKTLEALVEEVLMQV